MSLDKSFLKIDIFHHAMDSKLGHNLSECLLSTLSNMLGLHYASDKKLQTVEKDIQKYANDLGVKLKTYIGEEVILEDTFDMSMNLFAIAISPLMPSREEPPSLATNKSAVVGVVANLCYPDGDISADEAKDLDIAVGEIISSGNSATILALLEKEPGMFKALIKRKTSSKDILSNLSRAANAQVQKNGISSDFAQFAGLTVSSVLGFAANFAAAAYIDAVAAVAIIPTTVAAVKYGTQIGEAIGSKLAEFDGEFKKHTGNLKEMLQNFVPTFRKPSQGKTNIVEHKNEINKSNALLNEVKQEVETHVNTKHDIENAVEIEKIKTEAKSIGKDAI